MTKGVAGRAGRERKRETAEGEEKTEGRVEGGLRGKWSRSRERERRGLSCRYV